MKYIFCSLMFSDIDEDIRRSKGPNAISGHKFQESIIRGLLENNCDVYVINVPRVRHFPDYPEKRIREQTFILDSKEIGKSIGFNNRFLISYISQYINLKKQMEKILREHEGEECILMTFNSYLQQMLCMLKMRKQIHNIKICDIIGDMHGSFGMLRKDHTIKEKLVDIYGRIEDYFAKKSDLFVFLSKYMNEAFHCDSSRFVVVEGIYNGNGIEKINVDDEEKNEKILLYAGSLDVEYDIEHLLSAFHLLPDPQFKLFIAGNGNGIDLVEKAVKKDTRIHYLGVLNPSELNKYIQKATALVSPRKNNHAYVKYSFPSKTMECLASGKPYIAHKLVSEPDEYAEYIQYAEETDEALGIKITEVLNMSKNERIQIGEKARRFILTKKTPGIMCKRIISMCEGVKE